MPATSPDLRSFIARLPKVELHVHLEGSLRPETLRELARTKGWFKRWGTERWIAARERRGYRYADFRHFVRAFTMVSLLLEKPADYALATARLMEWLSAQNVKYAEVIVSAGVVLWKRSRVAGLEAVFDAISAAATEAQSRLGVRVNWILDAIRQLGPDHAREVLKWAARFRSRGVVGFGIGGDESRGPAELFAEVYREARDLGLRLTAHAGETVGPESIRRAVEVLGAERIGHGLSAARDPEVMALLRDRRVPLEVCLTSNVATGVLDRVENHPLATFLASGLVVTLNSDDPAMFGTSLQAEFELAAKTFALSPAQIVALCENSIRAAFLPDGEKQNLMKQLHDAAQM